MDDPELKVFRFAPQQALEYLEMAAPRLLPGAEAVSSRLRVDSTITC